MQSLKSKQSTSFQFSTHLAPYISTAYGQNPQDYAQELKDLDGLRDSAVNASVSPNSIDTVVRYLSELAALSSRFPIDEENIKVSIGWYNFVAADRGNKPFGLFSVDFERAAVMFNLAVIYGRLGNVEGAQLSGDTLKRACGYYLQASGIFEYVASTMAPPLFLNTSCDLHQSLTKGLADLMLAQAQECFYQKGVVDGTVKAGILAKLAAGCSALYASAHAAFQESAVLSGSAEGRNIASHAQGKHLLYAALAETRKANEATEGSKFGEEIARLQQAQSTLNRFRDIQKGLQCLELQNQASSLSAQTAKNLARAEKDNQLIYHEPVPAPSGLAPVQPAIMVKAVPFTAPQPAAPSIFERLIPLNLHRAVGRYQEAKAVRVNELVGQFDALRERLAQSLAQHSLPGALEAVEQPIGLPPAVLQKGEELRGQGGVGALHASIQTISELARECSAMIRKIEEDLKEESATDDRLRKEYSESEWCRPRSKDVNRSYLDQLDQLKGALRTAGEADATVKSRLARYQSDLETLCGSPDAVALSVPASHSANRLTPAARVAVQRVKDVLAGTEGLRSGITSELQSLSDLTSTDFPTGLLTEDASDEAIKQELEKYDRQYSPKVGALNEQLASLGAALSMAMAEFTEATAGTGADSQDRLAALQRLDDAFRHYAVINQDLAEGIRFYSSFQEPIQRLQSSVLDYVTCREIEREELEAEVKRRGKARSVAETAPVSPVGYNDSAMYASPYNQPPTTGSYPQAVSGYPIAAPQPMPTPMGSAPWNPSMPISYASPGMGTGGPSGTGQPMGHMHPQQPWQQQPTTPIGWNSPWPQNPDHLSPPLPYQQQQSGQPPYQQQQSGQPLYQQQQHPSRYPGHGYPGYPGQR